MGERKREKRGTERVREIEIGGSEREKRGTDGVREKREGLME